MTVEALQERLAELEGTEIEKNGEVSQEDQLKSTEMRILQRENELLKVELQSTQSKLQEKAQAFEESLIRSEHQAQLLENTNRELRGK